MKNKNKDKFYDALEKIFVGAPMVGEGGYVNLLKIKEAYYKKVIGLWKDEILADAIITDTFSEDFYNMLFSFFEKYFSECGSVYFVKTANWQRVYEKVYSDNRDVALFWKTHMLYYVKSDILFNNAYVKIDNEDKTENYVFYFDVGALQHKQNNEKKELLFSYKEKRTGKIADIHDEFSGDVTFVLEVTYKEGRASTNIGNMATATNLPEEYIEKAIAAFKKQTSVDFFINKDANKFLKEQLELFLHQYLLDEVSKFDQTRLDQIKTVKKYAVKLIDFIAQFEDELVLIWNKPKFVRKANYVISIDRLSEEIIEKIRKHQGLKSQIAEWQELEIVEENFTFLPMELIGHPHLPIDTKHFKDLELEILAQYDNLDDALNGRLIKSENYQALTTLNNRYKNKVQCVYIDPPFNTGNDFVFLDRFQDATWLSLMHDRLSAAKKFIRKDGAIYVELDHIAEHYGKILLDKVFGLHNYLSKITWNTGDNISGFKSQAKYWIRQADYLHLYTNQNETLQQGYKFIKLFEPIKGEEKKIGWLDILSKVKKHFYIEKWRNGKLLEIPVVGIKVKAKGTIWNDIFSFQYSEPRITESISFVSNQKPENLLRRIIQSTTEQGDLVLDFFLGSGTTVAVAQKLNRKWLGIEMGEFFYETYLDTFEIKKTKNSSIGADDDDSEENDDNQKDLGKNLNPKCIVEKLSETMKSITYRIKKLGVLGRLKNVINGDKTFSSLSSSFERRPHLTDDINWEGGGFFKYYELEQYEDVLNHIHYGIDKDELFARDIFNQYVFFADDKLTNVLTNKDGEVKLDLNSLYPDIDLPETISLLYGKPIEKITEDAVKLEGLKEPIKYNVATMSNEEKLAFAKLLKPLLWWGR